MTSIIDLDRRQSSKFKAISQSKPQSRLSDLCDCSDVDFTKNSPDPPDIG